LRAYLLQTHQMLFDAHWHGFRVFGGVPARGIYDSAAGKHFVLRTECPTSEDCGGSCRPGPIPFKILEWQVNIRFLAMANHDVFEPEFCNPASGWEKGQVEKNVRGSRHQILQAMPDFPDIAALNDWLEQRCLDLWMETPHGKQPGTIADVWADERAVLMPLPVAFDGFVGQSKRGSAG
jgi:hypothetical protein